MHARYANLDFARLAQTATTVQDAGYTPEAVRQFTTDYPPELARLRRKARLRPVPVNGNPAAGSKLGYFQTTLTDGTLGYFQRRTDDCVQAALATLLQMPPDQVPDLHLDQRTAEGNDPDQLEHLIEPLFEQWTARHGLTIVTHATPPRSAKRWIGMMSNPTGNPFEDHCVIMSRADYVWDPTHLLPPAKDETLWLDDYTLDDINYGITVEGR